MREPYPYPQGFGAAPSCSSCTCWLGGLGKPDPPQAFCTRKGHNTSPDQACDRWELWVCKAKSV